MGTPIKEIIIPTGITTGAKINLPIVSDTNNKMLPTIIDSGIKNL